MSNTTRESGFYWVKIKEGWPWTAMPFLHGCWHIAIDAEHAFEKMKDEQLFAINETRIPAPDEQQAQHEAQKEQHKQDVTQAYLDGISKEYGYCQSLIEGASKPCKKQCEHCKAYYAPLERQLANEYYAKHFEKQETP